ncbi:MAG: hypothetical protein AAF828_13415 [Bacteroidota bacterium]
MPIGDKAERNPFASWEQQQDWEEHNDYDGRFRIQLPAKWDQRVDSVPTPVGTLAYHTYWLQTPTDTADNVMYMLSYVDYPEGALHHDSTELVNEFLNASQEEAEKRMRGTVLFSTDKERNGYPGRFWRIDYLDGQASVRTQAYIAKNRYYALQTVSRSQLGVNRSTDKFFDSLVLF